MNELKKLLGSYTVTILPVAREDGGGFKATYQELALTVAGYGATQAEALAELEELALDGLADAPLAKFPAASAQSPWSQCSGRVTLRMPKLLHAKVDRQADEQGVSLNQWICQILESATTAIQAGREFGAVSKGAGELAEQMSSLRKALDQWAVGLASGGPAESWPAPTRQPSPTELDYLELHVA